MNLIEGIPGDLLKDALNVLDDLILNVSNSIPRETETVHNWLEKTSNMLQDFIDIIETTRKYGIYVTLFPFQRRFLKNMLFVTIRLNVKNVETIS